MPRTWKPSCSATGLLKSHLTTVRISLTPMVPQYLSCKWNPCRRDQVVGLRTMSRKNEGGFLVLGTCYMHIGSPHSIPRMDFSPSAVGIMILDRPINQILFTHQNLISVYRLSV
jgi:hypothetical protein